MKGRKKDQKKIKKKKSPKGDVIVDILLSLDLKHSRKEATDAQNRENII